MRGFISSALPCGDNRGPSKTRGHVVVIVNEGQTDHRI